MQSSLRIGAHRYSIEADLLHIENHGPFHGEEAGPFVSIYQQVYARHGYLLVLLDMRDAGPASSEARRAVVDWAKKRAATVAIAAVSGSVIARTTLMLILRAVQTLSAQVPLLSFFSTEAEAREWLSQRRPELRAHATAPPSRDF